MSTIEEMIVAKGLTVDCFDELDKVINIMEQNLEKFKVLAEKSTEKLKDHVKFDTYLPFYSWDVEQYEEKIDEMKKHFSDKIRWVINGKFDSLSFDNKDYDKFLESQDKFSARAILFYFFEKYGNEEEIRLSQIQNNVKSFLPNFKVEYSGKKGIKLEVEVDHWNDRIRDVPKVKQLADIIFGNVSPTETSGFKVNVYGGYTYHGSYNRIRFFKNGSAIVYFDSEGDCKKFADAIFTDPKELMNKIFGVVDN